MIELPAEADEALAVGWATVELDRAAVELAHLLQPGSTFREAPSSVTLGARCRVGSAAQPWGFRIILLEPETEGRLAATLARAGEGWVASWYLDPGPGFRRRHSSVARPGPLGKERLLFEGPEGAHRLLVDGRTIAL